MSEKDADWTKTVETLEGEIARLVSDATKREEEAKQAWEVERTSLEGQVLEQGRKLGKVEKERDGYRASVRKLKSHVEESRAERRRLEKELDRSLMVELSEEERVEEHFGDGAEAGFGFGSGGEGGDGGGKEEREREEKDPLSELAALLEVSLARRDELSVVSG